MTDKRITQIIVALNSTAGFDKYPFGNIELTKEVKDLESKGLIEYTPHLNRWIKSKHRGLIKASPILKSEVFKINLGLHLIKNDNETYSFVGRVPCVLGFTTKAGNTVTNEEVESQLRLPSKYRTIKARSFSCVQDAFLEAQRFGYEIENCKMEVRK